MTTTLQQNKDAVARFFADISAGQIERAFSLVSDQARWWVPGELPFSGTKTKAEYLKVVAAIQAGFPTGFTLVPGQMTAEDDRVAVEVQSSGQHVSGKSYRNTYHFLITLEGGRFTQVREHMDTQHLAWLLQP
jgi:ketosteroid isomerase-like protein